MSRNLQFLEKFSLDQYPAYTPQGEANWALRSEDNIPSDWSIQEKAVEDAAWQLWEDVLHQPETKKPQRVFLKDLAKAKIVYDLRLEAKEGDFVLPILLHRLAKEEALQFHFAIPKHVRVKVLFLESVGDNDVSGNTEKDSLLRNVTIRVDQDENSQVEMVYVHPLYTEKHEDAYLSKEQEKVCLYYTEQKRDSSFKWTSINLGDSLLERGNVHLIEEGARADIGGASYVQEAASQSYVGHIYAVKPYQGINIHNHGVVESGGMGHFASIADIAKGAHGTKAREENRFITFGQNAQAYADPTLLIEEHDVEASHAATVGQIDENQLYYLQSRGLSEKEASRLMTAAFLTPLFDRVSVEGLREQLLEEFYQKMHVTEMIGDEE